VISIGQVVPKISESYSCNFQLIKLENGEIWPENSLKTGKKHLLENLGKIHRKATEIRGCDIFLKWVSENQNVKLKCILSINDTIYRIYLYLGSEITYKPKFN